MADIAFNYQGNGVFDFALTAGGDIATGSDLESAVIFSLFTDRVDTTQSPDPRGVWMDTYSAHPIGSRLWTLRRSKKTPNVLSRARDMVNEALQWLVDNNVITNLTVKTSWGTAGEIIIDIACTEPKQSAQQSFQYSFAWQGIH